MMQTSARAQSLPTRHVPQAVASGRAQFLHALPGSATIRFGIILPIRDEAGLDELLREVNDPSSPSYRRFLTVPEFTERFAPTQEDYDAVIAFAEANGMSVAKTFPNRLLIDVMAPVANLDKAFRLSIGVYQHPTENRTFISPDREPSLNFGVPLWHIAGLDDYSKPRPAVRMGPEGQGPVNGSGSGPGGAYLPGDMRPAYYWQQAVTGSGQSVGLVEFDGYRISDVTSTFDGAATWTANGSNYILTYTLGGLQHSIQINNVLVAGATSSAPDPNQAPGDEGEVVLDIAQPIGVAPDLQQVRVYIAPYSTLPIYGGVGDYDIFEQMAVDDIAKQLSCSWYWNFDYNELHPVLANLATDGLNVFVASGDYGAWPNNPNGDYYPMEDGSVVAVGGTVLTTSYAGGPWSSETSWVYSGGGVSPDGVAIPSYQQLSGVINSSNGGSTVYRNAPDVAMEANTDNYICYVSGCAENWGGTSFAAPRWAGYLALANQVEEANHNTTLGFLNSLIYPIGLGSGYSAAFHDIDDYSTNDCCGQSVWYEAVPGYDLVTGWGTPKNCGLITALAGSCPLPTDKVTPTSMTLISTDDQPATGTATLTNNGPSPLVLTVYSIQVSGSYFSLTGGTCTTNTQLASGSSCTAQVTFNPGGCVSPTSGQLVFSDNSTTGGRTVSLTGETRSCTLIKQAGQ
jgi:subtilase family serine protease